MNTPSGSGISSVTLSEAAVTKTGHWTYSGGTLTFKSAYLATLENGAAVFTVNMTNGDTAEITITVGA